MEWLDQAACREMDPDIFFPSSGGAIGHEETERAKAACSRCGVSTHCRDWAIETNQVEGIWGGLSLTERRRHARRERTHLRKLGAA